MNETLLKSNGRHIRLHGIVYQILACRLGNRILVDADPIKGGDRINLLRSRSDLAHNIRENVRLNLFV